MLATHLYRTRDYKKYPLHFCGNNYLGLSQHPDVISAFKNGADHYGVGSGASHLLSGHTYAHHALEEELAEFMGYPRTLLFSSGYMANLGVITTLLKKSDAIFEDRLNHSSLIDAGKSCKATFKRYPHNNIQHLENLLIHSQAKQKMIVSDGVFSMEGDIAPLPELISLSKKFSTLLMIDDAHGIGVLGKKGKGTLEHTQSTQKDIHILMGTLGKAFGTIGAFVAGSNDLIEALIQFSRHYIYTTALPPAIAEATRVSLRLIQKESWRRESLSHLITYFKNQAQHLNLPFQFSITPIQTLILGSAEHTMRVSESLKSKGIRVDAIRPPTVPPNQSRLRISFNTHHTKKQIDYLLHILSNEKI